MAPVDASSTENAPICASAMQLKGRQGFDSKISIRSMLLNEAKTKVIKK
jgi:hypothetical protein